MNIPDPIPDSLKKSTELAERLNRAIQPALEQQRLSEITQSAARAMPKIEITSPALDAVKPLPFEAPALQMAEILSNYQLPNSGMVAALEAMNHQLSAVASNSINNLAVGLSTALLNVAYSPFVEWLNALDYSPIQRIIESLQFSLEESTRYKELDRAYLQVMYDCEWFPYAGLVADFSLFQEISKILATSRGNSKRRKSRIDKAILDYYSPKIIKKIKKNWRDSDLDACIRKMLGQAIDAHLRGEYALTISCLATKWEGMLLAKMPTKKRCENEKKGDIKDLVLDNGYDDILSDYYNKLIIGTCYSIEDVKEGVPNRHGIAHSWYKKYPNKKASLNAILLTDFIIGLTAKEEVEGNDDIQD